MVADARPKTVAYVVESTFATGPADWDATGTEVYTIGPDPAGAAHALVDNENYNQTHLGMHGKLRGLKNCEVAFGSMYLHGSPATASETAPAVSIPLTALLKCAWGGEKLCYAGGIASGTASSLVMEAGEGANYTAGDWGFALDATDSEGNFFIIDSISTDTMTLTDTTLDFTPDAGGADTVHAVAVCYPHGEALREHDSSSHTTISVFMKGEHAEDLYEFVGCKLDATIGDIVAGEPTKLETNLLVTDWDNDGLSAPSLSTTPAGEAPGLPGTGDDTYVYLEDKGTALASVNCYAFTPSLGLKWERVTGPNGTEGVHGHIATGIGESTLTMIVPYDDQYQAKFEADTRSHALVQVGSGTSAWGLYLPDLEMKCPVRVDQNGVTAIQLEFIIHEDTDGTNDYTRAPWQLLVVA